MSGLLAAPVGVDVETWANDVIRAAREDLGGLLPAYGSAEWSRADAPHRWASAVAAAEVRRLENTPRAIAEHLARELWLERLKLLEDETFAAGAAAWKQHWGDHRWLTHQHRGGGASADTSLIALTWAQTVDDQVAGDAA